MRLLLDENLPVELSSKLTNHEVGTVAGVGWQGVTSGELLRRASGRFDSLITIDRSIGQQKIAAQAVGVVLVRAQSNRLRDLLPRIPAVLAAVESVRPGELISVGIS
jgi:hypothetical protein